MPPAGANEQASAHTCNKEYTVNGNGTPLQLSELVDEPLPPDERGRVIVALRVTEEITEDAIDQLDRHIAVGGTHVNLREISRQLADIAALRKQYTARLDELLNGEPVAA